MSERLICRCPLCQLDRILISRLEQAETVQWYRNVAARIFILSWFPDIPSLISQMHERGSDAEAHHLSDTIYVALLGELSSPESADLAQTLLLRILVPALHKGLRTIGTSFPQLPPEDLAQQLVTTCLQIMQSPGIRRKTSFLGSSIVERTKRDAIRWAIRQYRIGTREDTDILIDETVESRSRESCFEPEVLLRSLLDKGEKNGLLSAEERKLLIAYEIEGMSGEELGRREGLAPKALSYRVRRVLDRLNQAFKKSNERTKDRPKTSPE